MKAIILAAGRGSRMKGETARRPKCLAMLAGKPLLHWQLEALHGAGITDVAVVCGYLADVLEQEKIPVSGVTYLRNPEWEHTNMLSTLLCAYDWARQHDCVVSYADIVYPAEHVASLAKTDAPIGITYDTMWEELWRLRFSDPLSDAETFRQKNGYLLEIGGKTGDMADIHGQYMGLLKLSSEGWRLVADHCRAQGKETTAKSDMTGLLRALLAKGTRVAAVPVTGKWCEVDSAQDRILYEAALRQQNWAHDWRYS